MDNIKQYTLFVVLALQYTTLVYCNFVKMPAAKTLVSRKVLALQQVDKIVKRMKMKSLASIYKALEATERWEDSCREFEAMMTLYDIQSNPVSFQADAQEGVGDSDWHVEHKCCSPASSSCCSST
jgi:hypothetical protein